MAGALRGVVRQGVKSVADYSDRLGYLPLRQQLQVKLNELGILAETENILVTNGATEAIHLVCQALLAGAGISVMVESPTPPLLTDRLLSTGMYIHRINRLADGPDLDEMRAVCEKHKPRAFFCSSVLHNPTCSNIAPHKAFQILRLAEEFDMFVVEDDTYGDLVPRATASPISRLATLDQLKRVIFVSGFSKTLGPGLRLGFVTANAQRMEWLTTHRVVQNISGSALSERILYKVLSGGEYRRHCEQLRNRLGEARPVVSEELKRWGLTVDTAPEAGMFLWASLGDGLDSVQVAERMLELGHLLAPAQAFLVGDAPPSSYIRVNIAEALESSMLSTLGKVLGRTPKAK
ncbi:PLP-dependent aminotransferase family protein [Paucibacter sp. PLA-PC-4]|uniref:aminotransferase-like domain-containing protein n=1 Tax=Paucibacter sp. PLA-PC-4 TaxID=2993655 RepID=UPI00224A9BE7|nr:PLP-dependent aminotransferase family protein [Paucibacter sp. PLA-PC-4]MCX2863716.1 PLP-dependent aminotransferase family protein [Paucibacter sp. PLA-PC-4]